MGKTIYVQIYCDRCGDVGDDAHWGQTSQVCQELKRDGWKISKDEVVCPSCQKESEE